MAHWSNVSCLKGSFWFKPLAGHHASTDNFVSIHESDYWNIPTVQLFGKEFKPLSKDTYWNTHCNSSGKPTFFKDLCKGRKRYLVFFCTVLLLLFFFSRFDAYNALCFIESKVNSAWNLKTMIINYVFSLALVFSPGRASSITLQPSILRARITTSRAELHRGKLDTVGITVVSWQKQNFCRIVIERFQGEMEGPSTPHCWSDRSLFLGLCFLCSCGKCFRKPFLLMWTQSPKTKFIFHQA